MREPFEPDSRRGIYCLANDGVREWFEPFVESLRHFEPTLPLVIIPYDDRLDFLRDLAVVYDFEIWSDPSFEELDRIGAKFAPTAPSRRHLFRKLAAFWGPLDTFMFLDSDIVLVETLAPMFKVFQSSNLDLVYIDADLDTVYMPGDFRQRMESIYGAVGWQSGAWLSRRDVTSLTEVVEMLADAEGIRSELTRWNGEQTVLNYLSDVGGWKRSRLSDLDPLMPYTCWARYHSAPGEAQLRLIHWAGDLPSPLMPHRRLYLKYRLRSLTRRRAKLKFLAVTWPLSGIRAFAARVLRTMGLRGTT